MNVAFPLILICVFLNTSAQLLLKQTMNNIGVFSMTWNNLMPVGFRVIFSPFFLGGMFLYVFSLFVWLLVLSRIDVTIAYPLSSIGYIFSALAAFLLLGENLSLTRVAGIVVIIAGVYLLTRT